MEKLIHERREKRERSRSKEDVRKNEIKYKYIKKGRKERKK